MWGERNGLSFETAVSGIEPPSTRLTVRRIQLIRRGYMVETVPTGLPDSAYNNYNSFDGR